MRFLVDANLPRSTVALLKRHSHLAEDVRDLGMGHAPDPRIAEHAQTVGAILLTRDLGFADVRAYPPSNYPGLLIMRLPDDATASFILALLDRFLTQQNLVEAIPHHLVILEANQVRFRPALGS